MEANLDKRRSGANGIVDHDSVKRIKSKERSSQGNSLSSKFFFFSNLRRNGFVN